MASDTSVARVFSVRWDGDKVRGVRMELGDGTIKSAGGIDDVNYTLNTYTFLEGETLKSLSFSSSGYGYGSLRRLEFTTSTGATFTAGPEGIDDLVVAPVLGAQLVGFHAWVNQDNFINAIAFHATDEAPLTVEVLNYSRWACAYANGVLTVDGESAIQVTDASGDKPGMKTSYNRVVQVQSGGVSGYCAYDGSAPLTISVFGDATFEAKFNANDVDGSVRTNQWSQAAVRQIGAYRSFGAQVRANLRVERRRGLLAVDDRRLPPQHASAEDSEQLKRRRFVNGLRWPDGP